MCWGIWLNGEYQKLISLPKMLEWRYSHSHRLDSCTGYPLWGCPRLAISCSLPPVSHQNWEKQVHTDETGFVSAGASCVLTAVNSVDISLPNLKSGQETRWRSGRSPRLATDTSCLSPGFVVLLVPSQLQCPACANEDRVSQRVVFLYGQAIDSSRLFRFGSSFPISQGLFSSLIQHLLVFQVL